MSKKAVYKLKRFLKSPVSYKVVKRTFYSFLLLVSFFSFYHIGYAKRIIPGVKVGDVFVGGMSFEEAHEVLGVYVESLDPSITLTYEGFEHEITGEDISLEYDVDASISRAFELGRTGNALVDTKDKLASLIKTITIKTHYDWDDTALGNEFSQIRGVIDEVAVEPKFSFDSTGTLVISESKIGKKVSDQGIYDLAISSFDFFDFGVKGLPVSVLKPELSTSDLQKIKGEVEKIVSSPLKVIHRDKSWNISPQETLEFVGVASKPIGGIKMVLNKANFDAYVGNLTQEVNKLPRGTVTSVEDGVVIGFELVQEGEELDVRKFTEDFEEALLNGANEVVVATDIIDSFGDPSKYGIFTLLGEGQSNYSGSAIPRAHNLTLAAERTNGVLVPPGEIYSFNNSVGAINGATGYDSAYIISGGRTVLGEGGGVCQTSTTLFRAVLNSGLPIVTRFPHAYRVAYYERDRPVGFDASIYQPSLDFRFKNDTPNYVLVQSSWDSSNQTLSFKIFGTPDGREVEISEPLVSNVVPPPEPLYQDDATLPKGTVKQVDFAAWGATAQFSRNVTRNGEQLHQDTFSSTYQPWRAVYLVGTN